jgi:hypothetical protein
MNVLRFPAPTEVNGAQLADELGVSSDHVYVADGELVVVTSTDRRDVQRIIATHAPARVDANPDEAPFTPTERAQLRALLRAT